MRSKIKLIIILFILITSSITEAKIVKLKLDAPVDAIHTEYILEGIKKAENINASAILITLDTPGGLAEEMRTIVNAILQCEIPLIVYVSPTGARAASAGFFILLSADVAAMAHGTHTGAAHPILAAGGIFPIDDGKEGEFKTLKEKMEKDIIAYLKSFVEKRGRNIELSEKGVTESKSYTEKEALEGKLIEVIAKDEKELFERIDGWSIKKMDGREVKLSVKGDVIEEVEMTPRQKFLAIISSPNIAFLLGIIGLILIYVEITHAGMIAPGVIGGICILLSMLGFSFLPINIIGVLLILTSIGLFIAEVKVQSFGVLGIGGIVCLAVGSIILVDVPVKELRISIPLSIGVAISFGIIVIFLLSLAVRSFRRRIETGVQGMVGEEGEVIDVKENGEVRVFIHGEYWRGYSPEILNIKDKVYIEKIEGLKLFVKKIKKEEL